MPEYRRQHYVPKFYLKNFGEKLFVFDKENEKIFSPSIEKICVEVGFYDLRGFKGVEKFLSKMENDFNIACSELIEKQDVEKLSEKSKNVLSLFIAVQTLRSKEHREVIKHSTNQLAKIMLDALRITDYNLEFKEEYIKAQQIKSIFDNSDKLVEIISDMKWSTCVNLTNTPFWTSDNPAVLHNEYGGGLGFKSPNVQIHFPISSEISIIISDPNLNALGFQPFSFEVLTQNGHGIGRVEFENSLQVMRSTRYVISREKDFSFVKRILGDIPELKDPNRPRIILKS